MAQVNWEVYVGNIGKVYDGTSGFEAKRIYSEYRKQSRAKYGRAADEPVTLFKDGEVYWEDLPKRESDQ
jgi:hypothetical protein